MADKTEYEAAFDAGARTLANLDFMGDGVGQFAVLPEGATIQSLEQFQVAPNRSRGHHVFVETSSLADYYTEHSAPGTMVEANYKGGKIKVTLDGDAPAAPGFKDHTATFQAEVAPKLAAWLAISGKPLGQVAFGEFLEDRAVDVVQPDAATIMEMVMTFDATKKVSFKQSTRLSDGQRQFQYVEENETRGAVTLPERITIRTPIYRGQEAQDVLFLLRYRIEDGSLRFTVSMHNKDEVMQSAFDRCVDAFRAEARTDATIYVTG